MKTLVAKKELASVDVVKTYKAALELYIQKSYNIIISDINLNNGLDGIEIIEEFISYTLAWIYASRFAYFRKTRFHSL